MEGKRIVIDLSQVGTMRELASAVLTPSAERTAEQTDLIEKADPAIKDKIQKFSDNFENLQRAQEEAMWAMRVDAGRAGADRIRYKIQEAEERHSGEVAILAVLKEIKLQMQGLTTRLTKHEEQLRAHEEEMVRLRSGASGRPSAMHLVVEEFGRLVTLGQLEPTLAEQGRVLELWFREKHPQAHPLTAKAIKNRIRYDYRRAAKGERTSTN